MSKATNVRATLIENETGGGIFRKLKEIPGAFCYTNNEGEKDVGMIQSCPCGCGSIGGINLKPSTSTGEKKRPLWSISGPRESPTLSPSVGIRPSLDTHDKEADGFHWHGHLKNGIWVCVYGN